MFSLENEKIDLKIIVDIIPIGIMIVDENLMVKYMNKKLINIFNRNYDGITNAAVGDCICCINSSLSFKGCGNSTRCNECILRKIIENTIRTGVPNGPVELQHTILKNNISQSPWIKISTFPIISEGENQVLLCISDITKYKSTNLKLIKLKETAESANKTKSEFLANISHEIRTPLNGIIGMTDLTLSSKLTEEQEENLNIVRSCADTLLSLINNILDLSKIEANKFTIEDIEFDMNTLVRKVIDTNLVHADEKNIKLGYIIDNELPTDLMGDPYRLEQILNNLISNAVKFTDVGYVNLKIDKVSNVDDVFIIQFTIEDTGIGISEDEVKLLFKSFSQVDGSITRKYGGTGLGLAISQKLVGLMGGKIEVKSKKGEGSKFYFTIKLQESKNSFTDIKSKINNSLCSNNTRILLVEDDKINQKVIRHMLKQIGYDKIETAANGNEALKLIEHHEFDMILMDIQMPELDGTKTTEFIREKEKITGTHIPIIAITAYALKGDKEKFLANGMDGYISKPIDINELSDTLQKVSDTLCNSSKDFIESYLKDNKQQEEIDVTDIDENILRQLLDIINEIDFYLKSEQRTSNWYYQIEKRAHDLKIKADENGLISIKKIAFKMELSVRKKQVTDLKSNFDKIRSILDISRIKKNN